MLLGSPMVCPLERRTVDLLADWSVARSADEMVCSSVLIEAELTADWTAGQMDVTKGLRMERPKVIRWDSRTGHSLANRMAQLSVFLSDSLLEH
jgi:hypothetical protein